MIPAAMPMPVAAIGPTLPFVSVAPAITDTVLNEFAALFDAKTGELPAVVTAVKSASVDPAALGQEDQPAVPAEAPTPVIEVSPFMPVPFAPMTLAPSAPKPRFADVEGQSVEPPAVRGKAASPATTGDPATVQGPDIVHPLAPVFYPVLWSSASVVQPPQTAAREPGRPTPSAEIDLPPLSTLPVSADLPPAAPELGVVRMPVAELSAAMAAASKDGAGAVSPTSVPETVAPGQGIAAPTSPALNAVSSTPVQPAPLATPLPALAVDAAMAERLAAEIGRGTDAPLKFRLTPERLGPLEITLGQRADGSQLLRIVTATAAAGDAMLAHSSALADAVQRHVGAPVQVAIERAPDMQDRGQPARGEPAAGHAGQHGQSAAHSQGQAGQHGKSSPTANLWRGGAVNQTEAPSAITPGDAAGRATHPRARYA